jgi:cyclophilin family peptidyl-prolyl cis-trans isomerase
MKSSHVFSQLAALALTVILVAACSPNITILTPTPIPAASTTNATAAATTATGGAATSAAVAANGSGQLSCVGVKDPSDNPPAGGSTKQWPAPENVIDPTHTYCAIFTTANGRIVAELYPKVAPKNVNSFVFLAQKGFYDGVTWHRVIQNFMAQTGDPTGTGAGGPGYNNLPLEVSPDLKYDREGRIGMARTGDPNSAGSQIFITFAPQPGLDPGANGPGYTIIGQVVEGLNVLHQIKIRNVDQNPNLPPGENLISVRVVDLGAAK